MAVSECDSANMPISAMGMSIYCGVGKCRQFNNAFFAALRQIFVAAARDQIKALFCD